MRPFGLNEENVCEQEVKKEDVKEWKETLKNALIWGLFFFTGFCAHSGEAISLEVTGICFHLLKWQR